MDCCEAIRQRVRAYSIAVLASVTVSIAVGSLLLYNSRAPLALKLIDAAVIASVTGFTVFYIMPWIREFARAACTAVCRECRGEVRVNMWRGIVSCIEGSTGVCYSHVAGSKYKVTGLDGSVNASGDLGCVKATRIEKSRTQRGRLIVEGEGVFRHGSEGIEWRGSVVVEEV